MTGRLEGEIKIREATEKLLLDLPNYVEDWTRLLRASDCTEATIKNYTDKISKFLRYINTNAKDVTPDDITPDITIDYYTSLKTKIKNGKVCETSDSYKRTCWYALNSFLGFLAKRDKIKYNYITDIDKPKDNDLDRIKETRIKLTEKDFHNILNAVNNGAGSHRARARQREWKERDMCILVLFMMTGMRNTAMSQINLEDINFEDRTLIVRDKGKRTHKYYIEDAAMKVLNNWLIKRKDILTKKKVDTNSLFISNRCERISAMSISDMVKKYSEAGMGVGISPHKIRAGFCSILYEKNPDLLFVSRAVGHADTKVTLRYIVTDDSLIKKSAGIMNNVITN